MSGPPFVCRWCRAELPKARSSWDAPVEVCIECHAVQPGLGFGIDNNNRVMIYPNPDGSLFIEVPIPPDFQKVVRYSMHQSFAATLDSSLKGKRID